jgi:hypothetical protein
MRHRKMLLESIHEPKIIYKNVYKIIADNLVSFLSYLIGILLLLNILLGAGLPLCRSF